MAGGIILGDENAFGTVLLIAGMLAFFVAIVPFVTKASDAAVFAADRTSHQEVLDTISKKAWEAADLVPGKALSITVGLKRTSELSVKNGFAYLSFETQGQRIVLNSTAPKNAKASLSLSKGPNELVFENGEGMVLIKAKN